MLFIINMSDSRSPIIEYISERFAQEDYVLNNILARQEEGGGPMMNIGPDQGKFLNLLIKLLKPKNILEVGSYYGYSSVWMGRAVKDIKGCTLHCLEKSAPQVEAIKEHLELDNLQDNVQVHQGDGVELMDKFIKEDKQFDMIFVDADKGNYSNYLEKSAKLLPKGGLLLVDNTIWSERVLNSENPDKSTAAIQDFNNKLAESEDFDSVIVTIQDGLAFAVRR